MSAARTKAKRRRAFIIWQRNTLQSGLIRSARDPDFFVDCPDLCTRISPAFWPYVKRHGEWMRETRGAL